MNFPSSPTAGSIYSIGDKSWRWNGYAWDSLIVDLEVMGNLIVDGNLTVSGEVTSSFSETVVVEDNIILLNSNVTGGSPSENAGIEVSRGASANVQLRWNESTDKWQFTNDGTQFYDMPTSVVNTINGYTGAFTLTGTANEVEITGATSFVVGLPDNVTITNLTVINSVTASHFDGPLLGRVTTHVKNDDTITLTAGMPVYISGYQGSGNSGILLVKAADASNSSTMPALGLVETTLAVNGQGHVVELGLLGSLNTNGFSANQVVYIAPGGGLTATRPTAGTHLVQNIGRVVNASTNQGQIIVLGPGRSNDVPNRIVVRDYLEMPNGQTATSIVTTVDGVSGDVTTPKWSNTTAGYSNGIASGITFAVGSNPIQVLEKLIYPYQSVAFTAFSVGLAASTFDIGATSASGNYTTTWSTSGPTGNWIAGSIFVSRSGTELTGGLNYNSSPVTIAHPDYRYTTPSTLSFSLTGQQSSGSGLSRSQTYSWLHRVYWGKSASASPTALSDLTTGSNSRYTSSTTSLGGYTYTFPVSTNAEYCYVITPTSPGSPGSYSTWKDINNLTVAPNSGTFTETNSNGVSINWTWYQVSLPTTSTYQITAS